MTKNNIDKFISVKRFQNYNNFEEYEQNIYLSQKYYILLSIFEISLRNSIDSYFKVKISNDWLDNSFLHVDTKQKIKEAKSKLLQRNELLSHDKIIAELSFGFWTSLFRKSYADMFRIKDIKTIFHNIPSKDKKIINRNILDKQLNHIRKFRNRVFHYEKIINNQNYLHIKDEINELLLYLDVEVSEFAKDMINKMDNENV